MKINKHIYLVIPLVVMFIFFFRTFLSIMIGAHDLPYIYKDQLIEGFRLPEAWITRYGNSFGTDNIATLWLWPFDVLGSLLGKIGMSYALFIKLFGIVPAFLFGVLGMYQVISKYAKSRQARLAGAILYVVNSYFLLLVDGGQIQVALAYGFLPLCYLFFLKGIDGKTRDKIIYGASIAILGFLDIRFIYVLLLIIGVWSLLNISRIREVIVTHLFAFVAFLFAHFYWIYPLLVNKSVSLPTAYTKVTELGFLSFSTFWHSFEFLAPHWPINVFGKITNLRAEFLILPVLSLLAPVVWRKNKNISLSLIIFALGVFLSKGSNPPFGELNLLIFQVVPGMSLFRDPTKFYFLIGFATSILLAHTVEYFSQKGSRIMERAIICMLITYTFLLSVPVITGQMTGILNAPHNEQEQARIAKAIEGTGGGRTLWIPNRGQLGFSSPKNPSIDMSILNQFRPFISQSVGSYEINNFLRDGLFTGQLLSMSGVRNIALPEVDPRREKLSFDDLEYTKNFSKQIKSQAWAIETGDDKVISVENTKNEIYPLRNLLFVLGPDSFYDELAKRDADTVGVVYLEQYPGLTIELGDQKEIFLYEKNRTDLIGSLLPSNRMISLSKFMKNDPDVTGWWKRGTEQYRDVRVFLQEKYKIDMSDFDYGHGWSFAEGSLSFVTPVFNERGRVFVRTLSSPKGGTIKVADRTGQLGEISTVSESKIRTIGTYKDLETKVENQYEQGVFHWHELGNTTGGSLTISTTGEINVITTVAIVPESEYIGATSKAESFHYVEHTQLSEDEWNGLLNKPIEAEIIVNESTPTRKEFTVENSKGKLYLGFTNTFSKDWVIEKSGYPLFSFMNAYEIPGDGRYVLYYAPQNYVIRGLYVSTVGIITFIGYLLWKRKS